MGSLENTFIINLFDSYMLFIYFKLCETELPPKTIETWLKATKDANLPPSGEERKFQSFISYLCSPLTT